METITFTTKLYIQEITDFYYNDIKDYILDEGICNDEFYFVFPIEYLDCEQLSQILEDIILENNKVVSSSYRLYDIVKNIVFSNSHKKIKMDLMEYFISTNIFNIEGYINFRLNEYSSKISEILYSVVKRNLCID